jgi:hypothetical protein
VPTLRVTGGDGESWHSRSLVHKDYVAGGQSGDNLGHHGKEVEPESRWILLLPLLLITVIGLLAMSSANAVFDAAQAIRPYLTDLLEVPMAQSMDRQLAMLLEPDGKTVSDEKLLALLQQEAMTREWLRLYLKGQRPADTILPIIRTYHPLMAKTSTVQSPRYVCPVASCHRDWYRQTVDQAIPHCPIHNVPLVRASKVGS